MLVLSLSHIILNFRTIVLIVVFAECMKNVKVPCYSTEQRSCDRSAGYAVFRLFPVSHTQSVFPGDMYSLAATQSSKFSLFF